jgi:hypothetical protein
VGAIVVDGFSLGNKAKSTTDDTDNKDSENQRSHNGAFLIRVYRCKSVAPIQ